MADTRANLISVEPSDGENESMGSPRGLPTPAPRAWRASAVTVGVCVLVSVGVWTIGNVGGTGSKMMKTSGFLSGSIAGLWDRSCPSEDQPVLDARDQVYPNPGAGTAPAISRVLYINMDWDHERANYMEAELRKLAPVWMEKQLNLEWKRVSAVDGTKLSDDPEYQGWISKGWSSAPYPAVQGKWPIAAISISHYKAIKMVKSLAASLISSNELVLIVEDDVEIKPDFLDKWAEIWPYVPTEWDVLRVGWFADYSNCTQVINDHWDRAGWTEKPTGPCYYCGAQGYIVNPASVDKILHRFEASKMTHSDTLLGAPTPPGENAAHVPPIEVFASWPTLAGTKMTAKGYPKFESHRRPNPISVDRHPPPPPPAAPVIPDYLKSAYAKRQEQLQGSS